MRLDLPLLAGFVALGVGFVAVWSNPRRQLNRLFFTLSVHVALWLTALHCAFSTEEGLFWVRVASAIGGFVPTHFWLIQQSIAASQRDRQYWARLATWSGISSGLAFLAFTEWFVPSHSTTHARIYGPGYYVYIVATVLLYGAVVLDAWRSARRLSGHSRLELQIWLTAAATMAAAMMALMGFSAVLRDPQYVRLQPLVVLGFYTATATIMTTHRVFNARQIFITAIEKLLLVCCAAACAYTLDYVLDPILPAPFSFLATTAATLWIALILNGWLDRAFQIYPEAVAARRAAFDIAKRESRLDRMQPEFTELLKGWGQTDHALVLVKPNTAFEGTTEGDPSELHVIRVLQQLRWATPERLGREKMTPGRNAVLRFLQERDMGVVIATGGHALTVLVGVGVSASRRPFTYPEVTQLLELASIMEGAFERAHLAAKVQHAEQLATVGLLGASVAHEIRNPLVTIKTFVQLLPTHYQDDRFREKFVGLMADEVDRIDRLTEQLLELAAPRAYASSHIALHPILRDCLDLVETKAAHLNVRLDSNFAATPDVVFTDAAAAKQVVLNLCFNAMQALEHHESDPRAISLATRNVNGAVEVAVSDTGPGIAPEVRARLFQPFQTTKSSGFGLGLAICSDILTNLNASISVDPPIPGQGATFRVLFPCLPSSS